MNAVPPELLDYQRQFSQSITTPFLFRNDDSFLQEQLYQRELLNSIKVTFGQKKLNEYNRQYWFRLLGILQEEYPLTCNIMSHYVFNQLADRYLQQAPCDSPYLHELSLAFFSFARKNFFRQKKLKQALSIDFIYSKLFFSNPEMLNLGAEVSVLWPYDVVTADYNLLEARRSHLREEEFALTQKRRSYYVFFKMSFQNSQMIESLEVSRFAARFLQVLKKRQELEATMGYLVRHLTADDAAVWQDEMESFFRRCTSLGFFQKR